MSTHTNNGEFVENESIRAWVNGWAISRGTDAPNPIDGHGFRIAVGLPGHIVRYVLSGRELAKVSALASSLDAPGTWLKVCAPEAEVSRLLPSKWVVQAPEFLMRTPIHTEAVFAVPSGYRLNISMSGPVADAEIQNEDGQLAAKGRVAIAGQFAMFDQVVTEVAHRRKGLGQLIMKALSNVVFQKDVKAGILVATQDGLALYRTIGWQVVSPVTSATIPS